MKSLSPLKKSDRNNNPKGPIPPLANKRQYKQSKTCPDYPPYERLLDLPKLIPLWPHELSDQSPDGTENIISKINQALRSERHRGKTGHWSYSLNRHAALLQALKWEQKKGDN